MSLDDGHGETVALLIDGYYPESDQYWDENWLLVRGRVIHAHGAWTFRDRCLTTFELEQVACWFDGIASGNIDPDSGSFTEPNLHFEYAATPTPVIRSKLAYQSAPPWPSREERLDGTVMAFPRV